MINIVIVEENWFNLLQALDDGEYDEPDEFYPGADENGDCYWGEEVCRVSGQADCVCDQSYDENLEAAVRKELKYS